MNPAIDISPSSPAGGSACGLSVRTPDQLLALNFEPSDIFLDDGVLARSQPATILGPSGVGKSRLTMQLAISLILGRPFLGLPVKCSHKRILFLQAENSNRRLQADLQKMKTAYTKGDWARINDSCIIHTIEGDHDEDLRLSVSHSADAVAKLFMDTAADIVFADPLNAIAKGNLGTAEGMLGTVRELNKLARLANPDASVVVVHHTLTGREGFKKAVGTERASYGRDSKALHAWTRGQINIAPGDPHDTRRILVACGKNSNGREFEPVGAILNTDTMHYEVDPTFSLDTWKHTTCGDSSNAPGLSPAVVAQYVAHRPMKKVDLVAVLCEETGCKKTKAYDAISAAENKTIVANVRREYRAIKVPAA